MKLKKKVFLLNLFKKIFKEFNYLEIEDVISIGKFRIFFQLVLSRLEGRKDFYALMPFNSKVVDLQKIEISGNLCGSNLIRSLISSKLYLQAINGIKVHSSVLIGPDVKLISANHDFENYSKWIHDKPIVINKNVWIGANVVILPGVNIGSNCIIGAGSIVTKSFEDNSIICGNPAKLIKKNSISNIS